MNDPIREGGIKQFDKSVFETRKRVGMVDLHRMLGLGR